MLNKHLSIIYIKSMIVSIIWTLLIIILLSVSFAMLLGGGSKLWLFSIIIFASFFILSIMTLFSIMKSGIDIKHDIVIFPDIDPSKGKHAHFNIHDLKEIQLRDGNGKVLDPYKDSLYSARFVFILNDGSEAVYYPVALTIKQYEKVKIAMTEGLPL